jgi:hypothetical protein
MRKAQARRLQAMGLIEVDAWFLLAGCRKYCSGPLFDETRRMMKHLAR